MPLPLPVLPMSMDEFHNMEHRLGWKHEYWDGAARLSIQQAAVATFRRELPVNGQIKAQLPINFDIRGISVDDVPALVDLFRRAFDQGVEYAGWDDNSYDRDAQRSIESFFGSNNASHPRHRKGLLKHSYVVHRADVLVAAVLIRDSRRGPIIEPIMVHPFHQQIGLGSALLLRSIESIQRTGMRFLWSRCHLANKASFDWHLRNGFVEQPNYLGANHRSMHFDWQATHFERCNQIEQAAEMRRNAEAWGAVAEELLAKEISSTKPD